MQIMFAAAGTLFTFAMTALGAALVFCFRGRVDVRAQRMCFGFAAGVMLAASVWSLLLPAIDRAESAGTPGYIPAAGGLIGGVLFLMVLDRLIPHLHPDAGAPVKEYVPRTRSGWAYTSGTPEPSSSSSRNSPSTEQPHPHAEDV